MQLFHTFVSYSRADREFALRLSNDLRAAGVNVWLDQLDIPPGARWDRAVEDALKSAGRILVVLSPTSADSENVQDEIGLAFDQSKPIVPVLAETCEVPMRLRRLQYIDFTTGYDQGFNTLLTVMKLPIAAPGEAGAGAAETGTPALAAHQAGPEARLGYSPPAAPVAASAGAAPSRRNLWLAGAGAIVVLLLIVWLVRSGGDDSFDAANDAATDGTVSTFADVANVRLVNDSDLEIHEMYVRRSGDTDWGPDRLGSEIVAAKGGEHTLTQIPCNTVYDLKLVDEASDECEIHEQDVCEGNQTDQVWTITSENLQACRGQ